MISVETQMSMKAAEATIHELETFLSHLTKKMVAHQPTKRTDRATLTYVKMRAFLQQTKDAYEAERARMAQAVEDAKPEPPTVRETRRGD